MSSPELIRQTKVGTAPPPAAAAARHSPGAGPQTQLSGSQRYVLMDKIGRGGFGFVYRALDRSQGRVVAAKLIDLEEAGDEMEDVQQEIAVMSSSHCPQLTEYYTSFVSDNQLWIIMEHLEAGSLSDVMKDFGPLSEASCAYVIRELLLALVYLHKSRKIHRDIKAGNILVSGSGLIKLSDFGVTGQLTDSMNKRKTRVGTPFWMAPEVITETSYDENADIWSVGITAIELAKGFPPHAKSMHPMQVIFLIPKQPPPVLEGEFSATFKDFVATCLVKDPTLRPSSSALLNHPFLANTALTAELKEWAMLRVVRQEEQLKALKAADRAGSTRQLLRRDGSRPSSSRDLGAADGIGDLRTIESNRLADRRGQPDFEYLPPPPLGTPIKRASPAGPPPARGLGRDPLAAALAAANAAAALSVAGNINISGSVTAAGGAGVPGGVSPYLSPRSECDVSYSYSVESGHGDADSNNTSGWDFDLTIKTRNSQGSQYSYSYSGKNFPDMSSISGEGYPLGLSEIARTSSVGSSLQSPRKAASAGLVAGGAGAGSASASGGKAAARDGGPLRRSMSSDSNPANGGAGRRAAHHPLAEAAVAALELSGEGERSDDDAVVIEESTIQQYDALDPPMTDTEAFSAVLGVLARFKWQFVDRAPHSSDLPPGTDPAQVKQMRRTYRQYVKHLDSIMARNPGGVEYSRETPLRPSGLYKEVVVPAMGGVGSAAAVLLATDLTGGSGLRGLDPQGVPRDRERDREGELPVAPTTNCAVIDLLAAPPAADSSVGSSKKLNRRLNSRSIDTQDSESAVYGKLGAGVAESSAAGSGTGVGAGALRRVGSSDSQQQVSPRAPLASSSNDPEVYQSADALLNHLYASAVPGLSSPQRRGSEPPAAVSIVELERRRDRESRALLWALERCLLALDIQSGGGATSEVLSTLVGYMMEEMGDGEDGVDEEEV